jgi:hypothetical protein
MLEAYLDSILGIDLVLLLLSSVKSINTHTIPAFGIVFKYNTIYVVLL